MSSPSAALDALIMARESPRYRLLCSIVAIIIGLILSSVHWFGFVIGGALLGLLAVDLKQALVRGFGFGVLAVLGWSLVLAMEGTLLDVVATGSLFGLAIAIGLAGALVGSLARGVV